MDMIFENTSWQSKEDKIWNNAFWTILVAGQNQRFLGAYRHLL